MGTNAIRRGTNAINRRGKAKPGKAKAKSRARRPTGKSKRPARAKKSSVRLTVALEPEMIRQLDRRARAAGVTRDQFIAGCVRFGLSGSSSRLPILPPYTLPLNPDAGASRDVGAGLDQVLTWMADQQAVLTQIRDSLAEVTAAVPIDTRPPTPEPGDDDDDEDKPRRRRLPS